MRPTDAVAPAGHVPVANAEVPHAAPAPRAVAQAPATPMAPRAPAAPATSPLVSLQPGGTRARPTAALSTDPAERRSRALGVLQQPPMGWLADAHIPLALTYSDRFLGAPGRSQGTPLARDAAAGRLDKVAIKAIVDEMGTRRTELRGAFFRALEAHYAAHQGPTDARSCRPIATYRYHDGPQHNDAIDLFAREGTPVVSMTNGVVITAENGWTVASPYATSSDRGGNTVVVYSPEDRRVYRYAHLQGTPLMPGQVIRAGDVVGRVGSTGVDASQPGHGNHLHLEIRRFAGDQVVSLSVTELRQALERLPAQPRE